MAIIRSNSFARQFRRLARDERLAFLARLWAARGYDTTVEDGVVMAVDDADRRVRITVVGRWPAVDLGSLIGESASEGMTPDVVVGTHDTPRARAYARERNATFVPPSALREHLLYGIDRAVAEDLARDVLGTSLAAVSQTPPERSGFDCLLPFDRLLRDGSSTPFTLGTLTLGVFALGVLALGAFLVIAFVGVGLLLDDPRSDPPLAGETTVADDRAASDPSVDAGPLPGATDDGASSDSSIEDPADADAGELVDAHFAELRGQSRVVSATYEGPQNTFFVNSTRYELSIRMHSETNYVRSIHRVHPDGDDGTVDVTIEEYYHEDTRYQRYYRENDSSVIHDETDVLQTGSPNPYSELPRMIMLGALSGEQTDVSTIYRPHGQFYRVTVTGDESEFVRWPFRMETGEFRTTAYFTSDGRLVGLSMSYVDRQAGERASVTLTYTEVGAVDEIEPPSW